MRPGRTIVPTAIDRSHLYSLRLGMIIGSIDHAKFRVGKKRQF
jgi:hypothetical protein